MWIPGKRTNFREFSGPQAISDVDIRSKTLALHQFSPISWVTASYVKRIKYIVANEFNWIPFRNVMILHVASNIFMCNICSSERFIRMAHPKGSFMFNELFIRVLDTEVDTSIHHIYKSTTTTTTTTTTTFTSGFLLHLSHGFLAIWINHLNENTDASNTSVQRSNGSSTGGSDPGVKFP